MPQDGILNRRCPELPFISDFSGRKLRARDNDLKNLRSKSLARLILLSRQPFISIFTVKELHCKPLNASISLQHVVFIKGRLSGKTARHFPSSFQSQVIQYFLKLLTSDSFRAIFHR